MQAHLASSRDSYSFIAQYEYRLMSFTSAVILYVLLLPKLFNSFLPSTIECLNEKKRIVSEIVTKSGKFCKAEISVFEPIVVRKIHDDLLLRIKQRKCIVNKEN